MGHDRAIGAVLRIDDVALPLHRRADGVLAGLADVVDFDAAWLSVCDPRLRTRAVVASRGLDRRDLERLADPRWTALEPTGPAVEGRDVDVQGGAEPDLLRWAARATPSGLHGGPGVVLREPGGGQVGFLGLLYRGGRAPPLHALEHLERHASAIAQALSPMRSLLSSLRMAPGVSAGVAVLRDGSTCVLPGLDDHPLLAVASPAVRVASRGLRLGHVYRSFLWPADDVEGGHVRLTVLAAPELPGLVDGTILLTLDADSHGLTPRELEVLGLLVNGRSNQEIAHRLAVAPRTVASHVEHVMRKLGAPSRTLAAVRAERDGCYVPPPPREVRARPSP